MRDVNYTPSGMVGGGGYWYNNWQNNFQQQRDSCNTFRQCNLLRVDAREQPPGPPVPQFQPPQPEIVPPQRVPQHPPPLLETPNRFVRNDRYYPERSFRNTYGPYRRKQRWHDDDLNDVWRPNYDDDEIDETRRSWNDDYNNTGYYSSYNRDNPHGSNNNGYYNPNQYSNYHDRRNYYNRYQYPEANRRPPPYRNNGNPDRNRMPAGRTNRSSTITTSSVAAENSATNVASTKSTGKVTEEKTDENNDSNNKNNSSDNNQQTENTLASTSDNAEITLNADNAEVTLNADNAEVTLNADNAETTLNATAVNCAEQCDNIAITDMEIDSDAETVNLEDKEENNEISVDTIDTKSSYMNYKCSTDCSESNTVKIKIKKVLSDYDVDDGATDYLVINEDFGESSQRNNKRKSSESDTDITTKICKLDDKQTSENKRNETEYKSSEKIFKERADFSNYSIPKKINKESRRNSCVVENNNIQKDPRKISSRRESSCADNKETSLIDTIIQQSSAPIKISVVNRRESMCNDTNTSIVDTEKTNLNDKLSLSKLTLSRSYSVESDTEKKLTDGRHQQISKIIIETGESHKRQLHKDCVNLIKKDSKESQSKSSELQKDKDSNTTIESPKISNTEEQGASSFLQDEKTCSDEERPQNAQGDPNCEQIPNIKRNQNTNNSETRRLRSIRKRRQTVSCDTFQENKKDEENTNMNIKSGEQFVRAKSVDRLEQPLVRMTRSKSQELGALNSGLPTNHSERGISIKKRRNTRKSMALIKKRKIEDTDDDSDVSSMSCRSSSPDIKPPKPISLKTNKEIKDPRLERKSKTYALLHELRSSTLENGTSAPLGAIINRSTFSKEPSTSDILAKERLLMRQKDFLANVTEKVEKRKGSLMEELLDNNASVQFKKHAYNPNTVPWKLVAIDGVGTNEEQKLGTKPICKSEVNQRTLPGPSTSRIKEVTSTKQTSTKSKTGNVKKVPERRHSVAVTSRNIESLRRHHHLSDNGKVQEVDEKTTTEKEATTNKDQFKTKLQSSASGSKEVNTRKKASSIKFNVGHMKKVLERRHSVANLNNDQTSSIRSMNNNNKVPETSEQLAKDPESSQSSDVKRDTRSYKKSLLAKSDIGTVKTVVERRNTLTNLNSNTATKHHGSKSNKGQIVDEKSSVISVNQNLHTSSPNTDNTNKVLHRTQSLTTETPININRDKDASNSNGYVNEPNEKEKNQKPRQSRKKVIERRNTVTALDICTSEKSKKRNEKSKTKIAEHRHSEVLSNSNRPTVTTSSTSCLSDDKSEKTNEKLNTKITEQRHFDVSSSNGNPDKNQTDNSNIGCVGENDQQLISTQISKCIKMVTSLEIPLEETTSKLEEDDFEVKTAQPFVQHVELVRAMVYKINIMKDSVVEKMTKSNEKVGRSETDIENNKIETIDLVSDDEIELVMKINDLTHFIYNVENTPESQEPVIIPVEIIEPPSTPNLQSVVNANLQECVVVNNQSSYLGDLSERIKELDEENVTNLPTSPNIVSQGHIQTTAIVPENSVIKETPAHLPNREQLNNGNVIVNDLAPNAQSTVNLICPQPTNSESPIVAQLLQNGNTVENREQSNDANIIVNDLEQNRNTVEATLENREQLNVVNMIVSDLAPITESTVSLTCPQTTNPESPSVAQLVQNRNTVEATLENREQLNDVNMIVSDLAPIAQSTVSLTCPQTTNSESPIVAQFVQNRNTVEATVENREQLNNVNMIASNIAPIAQSTVNLISPQTTNPESPIVAQLLKNRSTVEATAENIEQLNDVNMIVSDLAPFAQSTVNLICPQTTNPESPIVAQLLQNRSTVETREQLNNVNMIVSDLAPIRQSAVNLICPETTNPESPFVAQLLQNRSTVETTIESTPPFISVRRNAELLNTITVPVNNVMTVMENHNNNFLVSQRMQRFDYQKWILEFGHPLFLFITSIERIDEHIRNCRSLNVSQYNLDEMKTCFKLTLDEYKKRLAYRFINYFTRESTLELEPKKLCYYLTKYFKDKLNTQVSIWPITRSIYYISCLVTQLNPTLPVAHSFNEMMYCLYCEAFKMATLQQSQQTNTHAYPSTQNIQQPRHTMAGSTSSVSETNVETASQQRTRSARTQMTRSQLKQFKKQCETYKHFNELIKQAIYRWQHQQQQHLILQQQQLPILQKQLPTLQQQPSVLQQQPPVVHQQIPVVQQQIPVVQQQLPVIQQQPPVVQQQSPVLQQQPPVLQQQPSVLQQRSPVLQQQQSSQIINPRHTVHHRPNAAVTSSASVYLQPNSFTPMQNLQRQLNNLPFVSTDNSSVRERLPRNFTQQQTNVDLSQQNSLQFLSCNIQRCVNTTQSFDSNDPTLNKLTNAVQSSSQSDNVPGFHFSYPNDNFKVRLPRSIPTNATTTIAIAATTTTATATAAATTTTFTTATTTISTAITTITTAITTAATTEPSSTVPTASPSNFLSEEMTDNDHINSVITSDDTRQLESRDSGTCSDATTELLQEELPESITIKPEDQDDDDDVIDVEQWYLNKLQSEIIDVDAYDDEIFVKTEHFISLKSEEEDLQDESSAESNLELDPLPRNRSADSGHFSPPTQIELPEVLMTNRTCICFKKADLVCQCKLAIYCSRECQINNWSQHKDICLKSREDEVLRKK